MKYDNSSLMDLALKKITIMELKWRIIHKCGFGIDMQLVLLRFL